MCRVFRQDHLNCRHPGPRRMWKVGSQPQHLIRGIRGWVPNGANSLCFCSKSDSADTPVQCFFDLIALRLIHRPRQTMLKFCPWGDVFALRLCLISSLSYCLFSPRWHGHRRSGPVADRRSGPARNIVVGPDRNDPGIIIVNSKITIQSAEVRLHNTDCPSLVFGT